MKEVDQRKGHSQWYAILLIEQLNEVWKLITRFNHVKVFNVIDYSICSIVAKAKTLLRVGGKKSWRREILNTEYR